MLLRIFPFCLALLAVLSLRSQTVAVRVGPLEDGPTISRHIYGHFAEHLGRSIYGGFYVGEDSPIPNTAGVRTDVVEALRALQIPNLRWPGGCFADTYHWKDGIGPREDRPSMLNVWWGNVREDNSFGTHDFLNLCELLDTEPYLSANVGSGTAQELADWVKYTTHPAGSSPMPELRAQNGRKEPWDVKFWGIGNEAWGCGGHMRPEYYADVYRRFATFMTDWGNSDELVRIASGASSADYKWTEVLMQNIPPNLIEAIALHHYSVIDWGDKGPATGFTEQQYFQTLREALRMQELIDEHVAIMDRYDPERRVDLFVDEWGGWYDVEPGTNPGFLYQQNTVRDAVLAAATLNIFNNRAERVKMANIAQAVNVLQAVILTDEERLLLTPTYHVFRMYTSHHDAELLRVEFNSPGYALRGDSLPALSISASRDTNGTVHLSLVNIHSDRSYRLDLDLSEVKVSSVIGEILTGDSLDAHNTFERPDGVVPVPFEAAELAGGRLRLTLPPHSVVTLTASD